MVPASGEHPLGADGVGIGAVPLGRRKARVPRGPRIEDTPLPQLLAPRLYCDLFPELRPGIDRIIDTWRADRTAEQATKRPVAQARVPAAPVAGASTLYITSDLFAITEPWQTDLDRPAGSLLDDIVERYHLPLRIDYEGRFGVRVGYRLMHREHALDRSAKLAEQGVADREVVWVETRLEPFAVVAPHGGDTGSQVYRSDRSVAPLLDAVLRPASARSESYRLA